MEGRGLSTPPFPLSFSGPVLVCGSAQCLPDDLDRAREIFPDAPVIAVNAAPVKASFLFTLHPKKMPLWSERRRRFGHGFSTHTTEGAQAKSRVACDYVWDFPGGNGTSAWGARRLAGFLGFSPVVLCGAPLSPGPYVSGMNAKMFGIPSVVEGYRRFIEQDTDWHDGVFAMSGWTRDFFGAPGW